MKTIQFCICTLTLLILTACSDGVSSSSGSNAQQGVFIDSAVEGVTYTTPTRSGTTDSNGTFVYLFGEVVTFSIGGITLGSAVGQPQLTPIDLVPGAIDATDQQVTNILRFVQSLDADSDPSNGISIPAAVLANAAGQTLDFNQATVAFEADANALLALLYPVPAMPPALVSEAAALAHFTGAGGAPQSATQEHWSSPGSQNVSPQNGGAPQSISQLNPSSVPSQTVSPQHEPIAGTLVQETPPSEQRLSPQSSGFWPSPSPQQKRLLGLPFCLPLQSSGQETQSSPSPASQTPLPQSAPDPPAQA